MNDNGLFYIGYVNTVRKTVLKEIGAPEITFLVNILLLYIVSISKTFNVYIGEDKIIAIFSLFVS